MGVATEQTFVPLLSKYIHGTGVSQLINSYYKNETLIQC